MTRRFNVEEAQRAFDAAARDAKSGPRDVRAGRFAPTGQAKAPSPSRTPCKR